MDYIVQSSEKTRKSGNDAETEALLYLMTERDDSNDIFYFVIDFFNDLTGLSKLANNLWDVQSKAKSNVSGKEIGKELVTLFKNYLSEIDFNYYILFLGGVSNGVRIDDTKYSFGIENIKENAQISLIKGLKEEAVRKNYIKNEDIKDDSINKFLRKVTFVINSKTPEEYVKNIIKEHTKLIKDKEQLTAIFNEIRNQQSSKKNSANVEGVLIHRIEDVLTYGRYLTSSEIKLLVLNRLINANPINSSPPASFVEMIKNYPPETKKNLYDECKASISRALFDKNASDLFWQLLDNIYNLVIENPMDTIESIYEKIDHDIKKSQNFFDVLSMEYFIATVKDGIEK